MLLKRERLTGVDPSLVKVVEKASELCPFDVMVVEGKRTKERQEELYAQGRTKPGKMVTWTLKSKHIEGKAVDLAPYVHGKIAWNDIVLFVTMGRAMRKASVELGVPIRWGMDWDNDDVLQEKGETDGPHFELQS